MSSPQNIQNLAPLDIPQSVVDAAVINANKIDLSVDMTDSTGLKNAIITAQPVSGIQPKTLSAAIKETTNLQDQGLGVLTAGIPIFVPGPDGGKGYSLSDPLNGETEIVQEAFTTRGGAGDPKSRPIKVRVASLACITFVNYYDACIGWPIGNLGGYGLNCCGGGGCVKFGVGIDDDATQVPGNGTNTCYSRLVSSSGEVCVSQRPANCSAPSSIDRPIISNQDGQTPDDISPILEHMQDLPAGENPQQTQINTPNGDTLGIIETDGNGQATRLVSGVTSVGGIALVPVIPADKKQAGTPILIGQIQKSGTGSLPGNSPNQQPELQTSAIGTQPPVLIARVNNIGGSVNDTPPTLYPIWWPELDSDPINGLEPEFEPDPFDNSIPPAPRPEKRPKKKKPQQQQQQQGGGAGGGSPSGGKGGGANQIVIVQDDSSTSFVEIKSS